MSALEEKPQNFSNKGKVVESFEKMMLSWMDSYIFLVAAKSLEKCDSGKGGTVAINDVVIVHSSFKADEEKKKKSSQYSFCTHLNANCSIIVDRKNHSHFSLYCYSSWFHCTDNYLRNRCRSRRCFYVIN